MGKKGKMPDMNLPIWFDGQNINEALFCEEFLRERRIIFANGAFFTPDGRVTDDLPLRGEIYDKLKFCAVNNIPRKITNILEVLKLEAQVPDFPPEQDRIHVANGTLLQNGTFTEGRPAIVRSRLPIAYNPDAPAPVVWLNFLDDLLHTEDIPTLQEFIGYCLIPSNKGQRMMVIKGNGGEGKSQIGAVLSAIFGMNMKDGSIGKISENRFARADLEHMLNAKGKKILKSSYSVLQDDFFNFMRNAGYTDVERGERGSTEEHLTVTQFKVQAEQQRLEAVTGQVAQAEQSLADAKAATEKQKKKLEALKKETQAAKSVAMTAHEIESMGKKNPITGNVTMTADECRTLKDYAVSSFAEKSEKLKYKQKFEQADKNAKIWKDRFEKLNKDYEELKQKAQPFLDAIEIASEKVWAFINAILARGKELYEHKHPARNRGQDMEI